MVNPVEAVLEATTRYLVAIEALSDDDLRAPSALPGWTRGHVLGHVALNAQGLGRALRGARRGEPTTIYDSNEARDADIEERATGSAADLVAFNQLAALQLAGELRLMKALVTVERTPGGPVVDAAKVVEMRWREVEIHFADLLSGYRPSDWPAPFASYLLDEVARDRGAAGLDLTLHVRDQERTVLVGKGGHGVAGTAGDLAWWLVGRGAGEGLTSTRELPELGAWR